ncbi:hypothetical protein NE237_014987 [Protea cynaroides]|uniref:poly(A)-specific ribonuclease n=1 Tax=Protea cynaroides TaxID=273540 RepID=A0A9Q0KDD4_9MAGN|nr:hypothetical protein NE237_014987 [Protea cynaroides]
MEKQLNDYQQKPVIIIDVWSHNLKYEFSRIGMAAPFFPFVSIDTEFPGVVIQPRIDGSKTGSSSRSSRSSINYKTLKANVDSLHFIQLGITLTDFNGNFPDFGGSCRIIWQFNFKEFDVSDRHAPDSIALLRQQGINFEKNRKEGVDSISFRKLLFSSSLIFYNTIRFYTYDFAYLLKIITGQPLPNDIAGFYNLMRLYFGRRIYDVKEMIKFCDGVFGGLERVASIYELKRIAGNAHCAGSDSLLTWDVFHKIFVNSKGVVKGGGCHSCILVTGFSTGLAFLGSLIYDLCSIPGFVDI